MFILKRPVLLALQTYYHNYNYNVHISFDFFQKEEKQLEATVDALIHRVQDIKNSIASFLFKLENEYQTLNW